ncbi:MAG: prepilin-type N-terminal cleavage/methylation domain-containing protein [Rhodoferax sp.]|nr:prepilin-type N-terminal cleavage/methylation domain-containing protein [Rhodoferax sp.]
MSRRSARAQGGFTMVELAIVLVVAGLILVAVLKGTDTVNKAKVERAVADLKGLQGMLLETQKRIGRFPGDCNNDGIIAIYPAAVRTWLPTPVVTTTKPDLDATNRDVALNGRCGTPVTGTMINDLDPGQIVAVEKDIKGAAADTSNLVFNELRRSGVVDGARTNMELAKHSNGDVFMVGSMQNAALASGSVRANVIVMYGIPVWMAEAIDAQIDGASADYAITAGGVAGPASNGRVRRWDNQVTVASLASATFTAATGTGQYNHGTTLLTRDDLISISYQFDTVKLVN